MINQVTAAIGQTAIGCRHTSASTPRDEDEGHESSQPSHLQRSHHKQKLTEQQFIVGKKE